MRVFDKMPSFGARSMSAMYADYWNIYYQRAESRYRENSKSEQTKQDAQTLWRRGYKSGWVEEYFRKYPEHKPS